MSSVATERYLVLIGNSGSGKSWMLNRLVGKDVFDSDVSVSGVTKHLELITMIDPTDRRPIQLANIPGLIELDKHKEFCEGYGLQKLPIIANNIDPSLEDGEVKEAKLQKYLAGLKAQLRGFKVDTDVQLIENDADPTKILQKVCSACETFPWQYMPSPKKEMNFDENDKELQAVKREYDHKISQLMTQLEQNRAEFDRLTREAKAQEDQQKRVFDQKMAALQSEIDDYRSQSRGSGNDDDDDVIPCEIF